MLISLSLKNSAILECKGPPLKLEGSACRYGSLMDSLCEKDREESPHGWSMEALPHILCRFESCSCSCLCDSDV